MDNSRKVNSARNSVMGLAFQVISMLTQFVIQSAFIKYLGSETVGLNGLFQNILQFLSFAELGIGTAITFSLFKPLAEGDEPLVSAIMKMYQKIYTAIGLFILAVGLVVSFFITFFIAHPANVQGIQALFILYLLNTVVSYFFTYRRTLLVADQKGYLDFSNQLLFRVPAFVVQLLILRYTQSYALFLFSQIVATFASNYTVYTKVGKLYPYLNTKNENFKISQDITETLKKNVIGAFSSNVGLIVMYGTDNLLLSKFIGLKIVAVYTTYLLIINSVKNVLKQFLSSVISSLANFVNEKEKHEIENLFFTYMFIVSYFVIVSGVILSGVLTPFIEVWVGQRYMFSTQIVLFLIIGWSLDVLRTSVLSFMTVYGTYWEVRWKSLIEAFLNLAIGVMLLHYANLGVLAVIIATLIVNVVINTWFEPMILIRKTGISKSRYILRYFVYLLVALTFEIIGVFYVSTKIHGIVAIIIVTIIIFALISLIFLLLTFVFPELKTLRRLSYDVAVKAISRKVK